MNSVLLAMVKLYESIGFENPNVLDDINQDYLTENTCRNERKVLWYIDEAHCKAIYIDTLEFLSEEEIESELC